MVLRPGSQDTPEILVGAPEIRFRSWELPFQPGSRYGIQGIMI